MILLLRGGNPGEERDTSWHGTAHPQGNEGEENNGPVKEGEEVEHLNTSLTGGPRRLQVVS